MKFYKSPTFTIAAGLLIGALTLLANDLFFYESILIPSSSMEPTLLPNERVFLKRFALGEIKRFDLIVIKSKHFGHRIVKRVIALPGECVELKDSWRVVINGHELAYQNVTGENEKASGQEIEGNELRQHRFQLQRNPKFNFETIFGKTPYCLGLDQYYVLGDNRLASDDSRRAGAIPRSEVEGKPTLIWYSFDRKGAGLRTHRLFTKIE